MLQLAQMAVLARLLVPEDYGLMAMVVVVLSFAGLFGDLGLNSAYVQKQNVSNEQRSSLFWLNISISAGLAVLVFAASPLLAWFFGDERLAPLLRLSTIAIVMSALGHQVRMTAEKSLDFRPVILLEIISAIIGFVSAALAALSGWGVYALVFGTIMTGTTGALIAWIFVSQGWRPLWRFCLADVRPYLGFGLAMVGNNIVNQINASIDLVIGGRMLMASQLGLYSVPRNLALQIQSVINPVVTRVGFPLIAQVQNDIPRVRSIYLKTLNMTASTNAPLHVGVAFFAPEIVRILLGQNWSGAVGFLQILAIWAFVRSTMNPVGSLLSGMGRAKLSLQWNVSLLFIVPPVLWAGSHYGSNGLAWSLLILFVSIFVPGWYVLVRPICHAGLYEYSIATLRPFFLALLSVASAYFLVAPITNSFYRLAIAVIISAPLYFVISWYGNREWVVALMQLLGVKRFLKHGVVPDAKDA